MPPESLREQHLPDANHAAPPDIRVHVAALDVLAVGEPHYGGESVLDLLFCVVVAAEDVGGGVVLRVEHDFDAEDAVVVDFLAG
jgi:hypothetical protein